MGRLLNLVAPDPAAAVSRLPQPFRMIDKLANGIIQSAIDLAVQKESEKLAAEQLRDGTKVHFPSAVYDDLGAVTSCATSKDGRHVFCGNEAGQLVVVHLPSRAVVVRSDVHPGPITALDVMYLDPPPGALGGSGSSEVSPEASLAAGEGSAAFGSAASIAAAAAVPSPRDPAAPAPQASASTTAPGPAVLLASASKDMVCVYSVGFEKSMLSLLCSGDTPLKGAGGAAGAAGAAGAGGVAKLELSPDGRSLALTAGGGALAVYGLPEVPAEEWPGYVAPAAAAATEVQGGEGEGGEAAAAKDDTTPAAAAATAVTAGGDRDTTMKPLVWLPAAAAAATYGLKPDPAAAAAAVGEGAGAEGADAEADGDAAAAAAMRNPNPGGADPTAASRGAPTTHFRLVRLPGGPPPEFGEEEPAPRFRADAVFARWPGCNRLVMFQLEGTKNIPAVFDRVPNLRGGAEGGAGGGEGKEGDEDAAGDGKTSGSSVATSPACDWTMPFPVSASAATDDGNLLALGMTDGSVMLFNMRLAAVARTLERLGSVNTLAGGGGGGGGDGGGAAAAATAATGPLACTALSFWKGGDTSFDATRVTLAAATAAGWLALFDLEDDQEGGAPATLTPRGAPFVPGSLAAQREGVFGLVTGKDTAAAAAAAEELSSRRYDSDDDQEEYEHLKSKAAAARGADWFVKMVDLTGFSDLASVVSPPQGCEFAQGFNGRVIADFRGGGTVLVGVNQTPAAAAAAAAEAAAAAAAGAAAAAAAGPGDGAIAEESPDEAAAAATEDDDAAEGATAEGADGEGGDGEGGDGEAGAAGAGAGAATPLPPPSTSAARLCVYTIPPGHRAPPMMERMLENQPSLTSMPSYGGYGNGPQTVPPLNLKAGMSQKSGISIAVPTGAVSPSRSSRSRHGHGYGGEGRSAGTMVSGARSPSQRSLGGGGGGGISPRQEQSFASMFSQQTDLSNAPALDPVDPVAACLARLTQQGGGRGARRRRIARRHREIEAELEHQAAAARAPPPTAGTVR